MWKSRPFEAYFLGLPTMDYKSDSRRRTPWTGENDATPMQRFIDSCNNENYNKKHPSVKDSPERELLDNYPIETCRHCGSVNFQLYGRTKAVTKRYYCTVIGHSLYWLTPYLISGRFQSPNGSISSSLWWGMVVLVWHRSPIEMLLIQLNTGLRKFSCCWLIDRTR